MNEIMIVSLRAGRLAGDTMKRLVVLSVLTLIFTAFVPAAQADPPLVQDQPGGEACEPGNPELGEPLTQGTIDGEQWFELSFSSDTRTLDFIVANPDPGFALWSYGVSVYEWDGDIECPVRVRRLSGGTALQRPVGALASAICCDGDPEQVLTEPLPPGQYQVVVDNGGFNNGDGAVFLLTAVPGR